MLKPVGEFHRRGDGYQLWCKSCRRSHDAAYYASTRDLPWVQRRERQQRLIARMRELKLEPCLDCGGRFHPVAMTFDHRPGTTKVNDFATLARRGCTGLFERELTKCDLVCANCHAVRTYLRREEERARQAAAARALISEPEALYASAA
ncbi:MAG: hypothetical protein M3P38_03715 [Chloroflexota bacterium]|nr:hypothetical protein [Chloroflexota bacterium]